MATVRKRLLTAGPPLHVDAFELSEPEALGADVRLEVAARRTVLVGRNGAGKSATLEGIGKAIGDALEGRRSRARWHSVDIPRFRCEMSAASEPSKGVIYEFKRSPARLPAASSDTAPRMHAAVWSERCWRADTEAILWEVANTTVTALGGPAIKLPPDTSLLSVDLDPELPFAADVERVRTLFLNVGRVPAGVPRAERNFRVYLRSSEMEHWLPQAPRHDRIDTVALSVLRWREHDRPRFDEFVKMGARMGVWSKVNVVVDKIQTEPAADKQPREFAILDFDGTNIGVLADGTLRVAEILRAILRPHASVLLVEEPETSVHPGLLRRLLAEIDSYSINCQVIMTTHSPQVVASLKPEEVRLVRREGERTAITSLTPAQLARVGDYLAEEGTLGDFVFSGAADD